MAEDVKKSSEFRLYKEIKDDQWPIVYSPEYNITFFGMEKLHPFDASKWGRIYSFLKEAKLIYDETTVRAEEVTREELLLVHSEGYLNTLKWSAKVAGITEVPPVALLPNFVVQRKVLKPFRFHTGGTILAAWLALQRGWAINIGGGFHHCCAHRGGGFCAYADITLAIKCIMEHTTDPQQSLVGVEVTNVWADAASHGTSSIKNTSSVKNTLKPGTASPSKTTVKSGASPSKTSAKPDTSPETPAKPGTSPWKTPAKSGASPSKTPASRQATPGPGKLLYNQTVRKVMIVDLDAHQGNGHERDFMEADQVYIMDVYNREIYPHDGYAKRAINRKVEIGSYTDDEEYLWLVETNLEAALEEFSPDLIVYNAGTDILEEDPLGCLSISPEGVIMRDFIVFEQASKLQIPIVMVLSGGYEKRSARVIADSILNLHAKGLISCEEAEKYKPPEELALEEEEEEDTNRPSSHHHHHHHHHRQSSHGHHRPSHHGARMSSHRHSTVNARPDSSRQHHPVNISPSEGQGHSQSQGQSQSSSQGTGHSRRSSMERSRRSSVEHARRSSGEPSRRSSVDHSLRSSAEPLATSRRSSAGPSSLSGSSPPNTRNLSSSPRKSSR